MEDFDKASWQYQDDPGSAMADGATGGPRTSKLAIASLPLSLVALGGCCIAQPLVAAVGPIVAFVATMRVITSPRLKGLPWSISGLLLGLVFAAMSVGAAFLVGSMREAPVAALVAARDRDVAAFRAAFVDDAAGTDDEIRAFMAELDSRYGGFVSAKADEQAMQQGGLMPPSSGEPIFPIPFVLTFENATVEGEVELVFLDEATGKWLKAGSITIFDTERGDLVWPPSAVPAPVGSVEDAATAPGLPVETPESEPETGTTGNAEGGDS